MSTKVNLNKFTFSQSKIKQLEAADGCPRFWFESHGVETVKRLPSDQMEKGLFFEFHCFGGNAHDEGAPEPPESIFKKGKWSAEGKRMEEQVKRFKGWFDPESETFQGHTIIATQVKVSGTINGRYTEGIIDFVTMDEHGDEYMWDLKFTADVTSTFGPYGWGNYEDLDYLQQQLYSHLWEKEKGRKLAGIYMLVMDASTKMGHKHIPVQIESDLENDLKDRFAWFEEVVEHYNKNGWPRIQNKRECEQCPIKDCPNKWKENLGFNTVSAVVV